MGLIDAAGAALLLSAAGAFGAGIRSLGEQRDLAALYWLVVGALLLKAATEVVRPRSESGRYLELREAEGEGPAWKRAAGRPPALRAPPARGGGIPPPPPGRGAQGRTGGPPPPLRWDGGNSTARAWGASRTPLPSRGSPPMIPKHGAWRSR